MQLLAGLQRILYGHPGSLGANFGEGYEIYAPKSSPGHKFGEWYSGTGSQLCKATIEFVMYESKTTE